MMAKFSDYLRLIRVKHYIKNFLIFLPLFFSGMYNQLDKLLLCLLGFILFCFVSSLVYVFNDIADVEKDKLHETKKNRPLASGVISIRKAYIVTFLLIFIIGICAYGIYVVSGFFGSLLLPLIYVIINILYSKGLKNIALVDVVILVSGFLIRLFFGGILIGAEVSNYLYLTVMSGAFYMGFGKRRNEFIRSKYNTRSVLKHYNKDFLDKSMYVCLTLTIVFYSMWTVDPIVTNKICNDYLIWTIPILMIMLFQYSLSVENDSDGDPVEVILQNKPLLCTSLIYILVILFIWL